MPTSTVSKPTDPPADPTEELIGEEEGRSGVVYTDTLGYETIGIGCLVDPKVKGAGLCDAAIDAQFAHDAMVARHLATLFPHYADLNPVRQAVLVSMCFQLGGKPLGWTEFTAALQAQDYDAAAAAGLDSLWERVQTPARATREMAMLKSGVWVPKENT